MGRWLSRAVREMTWTVRGRVLAGLQWGEPVGRPIVFLHGFLDHAGAWSRVAAGLPGWRLAYDHRGHGRSAHISASDDDGFVTYHFAEYLADLDGLLAQLGPAVLVGHSMGGTIATMYAGVRPQRVLAVVTVDGLGLADGADGAVTRMEEFLDGVGRLPVNRRFVSIDEAAARLRHTHPALDDAWSLELAARSLRPLDGGYAWSWDARHRLRSPVPYRHDHHIRFLRRIRCPVLSVHPQRSPFQDLDVAALEAQIAALQIIVIENCGHMVHLDAPARLSEGIVSFLGSLPI
ncbi:MAG: alpha/beta hydrolase [Myxococcales bacterium]|nr:alpha/beta hydrolase [Myxococcales bacterium]